MLLGYSSLVQGGSIEPAHVEPVRSSSVPVSPYNLNSRTRFALFHLPLLGVQAKPCNHLALICTASQSNNAVHVEQAALLKWMANSCTARTNSLSAGKLNKPSIVNCMQVPPACLYGFHLVLACQCTYLPRHMFLSSQ